MPLWYSPPLPVATAGLLLVLCAACGGNSTGPAELGSLELVSGNGQVGVAGRALPAPLVVEAKDGGGHPLAGVTLQFAVSQGGGQVDPATGTTDANGRVAVAYTLGSTVGTAQQVTVSASGSALTATFSATATSTPVAMNPSAGSGQSARAGVAVAVSPAVRVVDNSDQPVAGVTIRFQVTRGGGAISGDVKVTGANGVAVADAWTMGPSGVNVVEATADGETLTGEPASFVATTTPAAGLDIVLRFSGDATPAQLLAFAEAEIRWESAITNDLPDAAVNVPAGTCGPGTPALNESIDDVLILASVKPIDGPGTVLAQAGPCLLRDVNNNNNIDVGDFPGVGVMFFDEADLAAVEENGLLQPTVLHEMGHVLGFGVLWDLEGLLANPSVPDNAGADTHFTGPEAIAAFDAAGGTLFTGGAKVPVDNNAVPGTADSHWRESVFENELMTGFVDAGPQPLSAITIASFVAEGYTVNLGAADAYTLPPSGALRAGRIRGTMALHDDVARTPLRLLGPTGQVTRTVRP